MPEDTGASLTGHSLGERRLPLKARETVASLESNWKESSIYLLVLRI